MNRYCIVTESEDGTVTVTAIEGVNDAGEDLSHSEPSMEQLDFACWLVACSVESEGLPDKDRIHAMGMQGRDGLPWYRVADDDSGDGDDVYAVRMGSVKLDPTNTKDA